MAATPMRQVRVIRIIGPPVGYELVLETGGCARVGAAVVGRT